MEAQEINRRFTYHAPKEGQTDKYTVIREVARQLAHTFNELCPESREQSLAFTKLEESVMWANAAIARREE